MQKLPSIAFVADDGDIRVNFGMYAGREATQAEIDDLARTLLEEVQAVTIVAEQRYLVDRETEAAVHQIRIQHEGGDARSLVAHAERWAQACVAERHAEVSEV